MARKIQVLPASVAQAIAAGEVVERPGSVVKELLENALDAGASEVTVELTSGGLGLIRVVDDGEGMEREDLPVALQRYATSKIRSSDDLFAIGTLGFRGEALPSIAAVSKMTIKTRVPHALSGTQLVCEGGEIRSVSEVGCPVGTEVEVRHLFYNVPVKRKFVKSIQTELRHCLNHFLRLSLSHPSVSFRLIHEGRLLCEYLRTDRVIARIEAIFGGEVCDHLGQIEFEEGEILLKGFASLPPFSKSNGDGIYLYVNRRFVRDRTVYKAIVEAYRRALPAGRFPVVILFITLPPSAIDVNVHPTKTEVKFREPERIFRMVQGALSSGLSRPSPLMDSRVSRLEEPLSFGDWHSRGEGPYPLPSFPLPDPNQPDAHLVREPWTAAYEVAKPVPLRILGQIQGTYIVCEGEGGLIVIDQHAAHERLLYERYKRAHDETAVPTEKLLFPIPMELTTEEVFLLMSHTEALTSLGFEIDPIGERMIAIRTVPKLAEPFDPKGAVRDLLEELSLLRRGTEQEVFEGMLVRLACRSAIRANALLKPEEMEQLVEDLRPYPLSLTCPHGRPVFFVISNEELARQFKRKA